MKKLTKADSVQSGVNAADSTAKVDCTSVRQNGTKLMLAAVPFINNLK
jgi:hypothetical protein